VTLTDWLMITGIATAFVLMLVLDRRI